MRKAANQVRECAHRRFLTVTDEVIRQHLAGCDDSGRDFVMGIYPMLQDETCYFLAADFDKGSWQEDAKAFLETCRQMNLPAVLERSRSGKGGHVWLFFDEAVPATLARKLGSHVLTETMERRPDLGLDSYDRFFPNQDTLPQGGFGNLIALPLQKRPREFGNSVFLDDDLVPLADQWAFLSSVRKLSRPEIEAVVRAAEARGRVIGVRVVPSDEDDATPWKVPPSRGHVKTLLAGPLPDSLELVLGNEIFIAKDGLPPGSPQPVDPVGSIPKPGILQSAGHAFADLRQAPHYRLCQGLSTSSRLATRLLGRHSSIAVGLEDRTSHS